MATTLGEAVFLLSADLKQFKQQLAQAEGTAQKSSQQIASSMSKNITVSATRAGQIMQKTSAGMISNLASAIPAAAARMGTAIATSAGMARTALLGVSNHLQGMTGLMGSAAGAMAQFGASLGAVAIVRTAMSFEQAMQNVAAVTKLSAEEMDAMTAKAKEMGASTQFSAVQSANALEVMARQGLSAQQAIEALEPALQLAAAGGLSIADAARIAGNTMKAFGADTSELTHINNVLAKAASSANTDIAALGSALTPVAPVAKGMGVSLETTTAILAKMQDAGFDASTAGTSLRNVLLKLGDDKIIKKLKELGVNTDNFRTPDGALDLQTALEEIERSGIAAEQIAMTFGVRGGPALSAALQQISSDGKVGAAGIKDLANTLKDSVGEAARQAKERLDSVEGTLTIMKSAVEGAAIEIGNALLPALQRLAENITSLANWIGGLSEDTKNMIASFAEMAVKLGAVALAASKLIPLLMQLNPTKLGIGALVTAFSMLHKNITDVIRELENLDKGEQSISQLQGQAQQVARERESETDPEKRAELLEREIELRRQIANMTGKEIDAIEKWNAEARDQDPAMRSFREMMGTQKDIKTRAPMDRIAKQNAELKKQLEEELATNKQITEERKKQADIVKSQRDMQMKEIATSIASNLMTGGLPSAVKKGGPSLAEVMQRDMEKRVQARGGKLQQVGDEMQQLFQGGGGGLMAGMTAAVSMGMNAATGSIRMAVAEGTSAGQKIGLSGFADRLQSAVFKDSNKEQVTWLKKIADNTNPENQKTNGTVLI